MCLHHALRVLGRGLSRLVTFTSGPNGSRPPWPEEKRGHLVRICDSPPGLMYGAGPSVPTPQGPLTVGSTLPNEVPVELVVDADLHVVHPVTLQEHRGRGP